METLYEYVGREGYYREEFDLYLLGVRWYDSDVGRFISRKSIDYKSKINLYVYVSNNPFGKIIRIFPIIDKLKDIYDWTFPPSLDNEEACHLVLGTKIGSALGCWYKCEISENIEMIYKPDPCNKEKCAKVIFRDLKTGRIDDPSYHGPYIQKPR